MATSYPMDAFSASYYEHCKAYSSGYGMKNCFTDYEPNTLSVIQPNPYQIPVDTLLASPTTYTSAPSLQLDNYIPQLYGYSAPLPALHQPIPMYRNISEELREDPHLTSRRNTLDAPPVVKKEPPNLKGNKRGRPTKNPVWGLFNRISDKSVLCHICRRVVKSACATNMSKHMERHHPEFMGVPRECGFIPVKEEVADEAVWEGPRRHRRTKHPVWQLFMRDSAGIARCLICNSIVRSPCSSNFMGHLNRHHPDHHGEVYNRWVANRLKKAGISMTRFRNEEERVESEPENSPPSLIEL